MQCSENGLGDALPFDHSIPDCLHCLHVFIKFCVLITYSHTPCLPPSLHRPSFLPLPSFFPPEIPLPFIPSFNIVNEQASAADRAYITYIMSSTTN